MDNHQSRPWLKQNSRVGSFYRFQEKNVLGNIFLEKLLEKRLPDSSFYLSDNNRVCGFLSKVYGTYEILSIGKNYVGRLDENRYINLDNKELQIKVAKDIVDIYDYIDKNGYDLNPVVSEITNKELFTIKNEKGEQKYPYYGSMTWVLSLSCTLWSTYFSKGFTKASKVLKNEDRKIEVINDSDAIKLIMPLRDKIIKNIRFILKEFINNFMNSEEKELSDKFVLDAKTYNANAISSLKKGWGYTRDCEKPSLYFTYSILEAYNDFDSLILIGGEDDEYFSVEATGLDKAEIERLGLESTKAEDYGLSVRDVALLDAINEGNAEGEERIEKAIRRIALDTGLSLFHQLSNDIQNGFFNDNCVEVTKREIINSSTSSALFNILYALLSMLYSEVNIEIRTKLMRAIYENDIVNRDKYRLEYKDFENCFIEGIKNVQNLYNYMVEQNIEEVVDRHYLTFDQQVVTNNQFARILSRENILVNSLIPLLINTNNLYVTLVTKYPEKQLDEYAMLVFEKMCNRDSEQNILWTWEGNRYDLQITVRYIDAIANYFKYYDIYERKNVEEQLTREQISQEEREKIRKEFDLKLAAIEEKTRKQIAVVNDEKEQLTKKTIVDIENLKKTFTIENSLVATFVQVIDEALANTQNSALGQSEIAQVFMDRLFKLFIAYLGVDTTNYETYAKELKEGLEYMINTRCNSADYSISAAFINTFSKNTFIDPTKIGTNTKK